MAEGGEQAGPVVSAWGATDAFKDALVRTFNELVTAIFFSFPYLNRFAGGGGGSLPSFIRLNQAGTCHFVLASRAARSGQGRWGFRLD